MNKKNHDKFQKYFRTTKDYKFYIEGEMKDSEIFERVKDDYTVGCVQSHWLTWQNALSANKK